MPRFKDLPKTVKPVEDGYFEEHLKGSVGGPVLIPAGNNVFYPVNIPSEEAYAKGLEELQEQLKDIKQDIQTLKEAVERMDRHGLKMKSAW